MMPDEVSAAQQPDAGQQQPVESVTLTDDQLRQLVTESGAAAGDAAASALAASLGDAQADSTVTFPDSMTVTVSDEQWQELMGSMQAESEFVHASWQISNSLGVLSLCVCAACFGALLSQMLFGRGRA